MTLIRLRSGYRQLDWPTYQDEFDAFVREWGLEQGVAIRALALGYYSARRLGLRLWITSGGRSPGRQSQLRRIWERGERNELFEPAADSTHVAGIGFDVGADFTLTRSQWASVGAIAEALGLRWGGRFRRADPVHFDGR